MKVFASISQLVGNFLLKRKKKGIIRSRQVHNLYTAKFVGIIFNATNLDNFEHTKGFILSLSQRGIKVDALGFVDNKEILDFYTARKGFSFFCKKNLNWYGKPKNPNTDDFIAQKYDLLIDLSLKDYFPIRYIVSLADAQFKVGRFIENDDQYDFMIDIEKNKSLAYLLDQLKYYLTIINSN